MQRALGLTGSVLLFAGVFLPILRVPIFGSVNYFRNGEGDGVVILVLALIGVALTVTRRFAWLLAPGVWSLILVFGTLVGFRITLSEARSRLARDLADNPFRGLAETAANTAQLEWAWAVLALGAGCLITAALRNDKGQSASSLRKCPHCAEMIQQDAVICRYCQRQVVRETAAVAVLPTVTGRTRRVPMSVLLVTIGGAVLALIPLTLKIWVFIVEEYLL
jgi:hypothetical protein